MFEIGLHHYLLVSILLMSAGVGTILTKRNAIGILIGVELILNAAGVNLVAFNNFSWSGGAHGSSGVTGGLAIDGVVFTMFVIVLAAAEAAIALAIFLNFYNNHSSIDVTKADELKG